MTVRTEGGPPRDDADDRTEGPDHEDQDGNREEPPCSGSRRATSLPALPTRHGQ